MQTHKNDILDLFRKKAVFTREEMLQGAFDLYRDERTLMQKLRELEIEQMIEITRIGHSTRRKLGIMMKFRLTLNGLDYLAEKTVGATYQPVMIKKEVKHRHARERIERHTDDVNPCNVIMKICYASGCYLKYKCDVFKK